MSEKHERDLRQEKLDAEHAQACEDGDYERARQIEERLSMPDWLEAMWVMRDAYNAAAGYAAGNVTRDPVPSYLIPWPHRVDLETAWDTIETTIRNLEAKAMMAKRSQEDDS